MSATYTPSLPADGLTSAAIMEVWLNFLALFEFVAIFRSTREPMHVVFPLYQAMDESEEDLFRPLYLLTLLLLICVRLNHAWDLRSGDLRAQVSSARVNAMVHVAEAIYFITAALGPGGAFQGLLTSTAAAKALFSDLDKLRAHLPALIIFFTVLANACVFSVWWMRSKTYLEQAVAEARARRAEWEERQRLAAEAVPSAEFDAAVERAKAAAAATEQAGKDEGKKEK